jgi:hypothetical protein
MKVRHFSEFLPVKNLRTVLLITPPESEIRIAWVYPRIEALLVWQKAGSAAGKGNVTTIEITCSPSH